MPIFFQEKLKNWVYTCNIKNDILVHTKQYHAREVCERTFDRSALIQMILSNYA